MLGAVWRCLGPAEQARLLPHVRVFARTSPTDKLDVIHSYIAAGFVTAMCGDGGNDCGALRAAHVGSRSPTPRPPSSPPSPASARAA